ncbi:cytochrome P450 9e2-like [Uranotaenia lowii]|uniref:cytochrome P450 9e2-like n=1 Tax=Uranotaenia lowii TaxID=190385 RepID=UPI002479D5E5|nr:cytochrome P450 9e2-like [Uranotaenia lowii]XP_055589838.1 cytochrome P450 9e2-like [Uranotaenia lowii]
MVDEMVWQLCALLIVLGLTIYYYVSKKYEYFVSKSIPFLKPTFLLGSTGPVILRKRGILEHIQLMYNSFPDARIMGAFSLMTPLYILRDPEMIKRVTTKDFNHFVDRMPLVPCEENDLVARESLFLGSLFNLLGQRWRDMRATLSPMFTGSKIRNMFELVVECGQTMVEFLQSNTSGDLEMKDTFLRLCNDVIASVAFGVQINSFQDRDNQFLATGKKIFSLDAKKDFARFMLIRLMPNLMHKLGVTIENSDRAEYFRKIIIDNIRQRKEQGIVRNDMIDTLLAISKQDEKWSENELIAQCFLFFLAGLDTVATAMTFMAYELCLNPDVQHKLYQEVFKIEESLTYEKLQQMTYMDQVVSETLRKWPPGNVPDRLCTQNYLYDDGTGTNFTIESGQIVMIPVSAIHHDPKYYPDPEKFLPERFNAENVGSIPTGAYLPFGIGPRNCIASRFALMEIKTIFYWLLKSFSLEQSNKTEIPLMLSKTSYSLLAENGVWMKLERRKT